MVSQSGQLEQLQWLKMKFDAVHLNEVVEDLSGWIRT